MMFILKLKIGLKNFQSLANYDVLKLMKLSYH